MSGGASPPRPGLVRSGGRVAAFGAALALALAIAVPARAQVTVQVTTPSFPPPVANAVTHGLPSSISLDVTNALAGSRIRSMQFRFGLGWTVQGGLGPPGWTVTKTTDTRSVKFVVVDCGQDGIQLGQTGRFRVDVTPPGGAITADTTDGLSQIAPGDPCGGPTGWVNAGPGTVPIPRKTLRVTATAAPMDGRSPLLATATYTVTNLTSIAQPGVALSPSVTPGSGWTPQGCAPATVSLAAAGATGSSATFSCSYTLASAPETYVLGATAAGTGVSTVGASVGVIVVGAATARFAFDKLALGNGDTVRATLSVVNETASPIVVTPPPFSALAAQNLVRAPGALDPTPATLAAGASADFLYAFIVSGLVGAAYEVQGVAATTAGASNVAVTPAGVIAGARIEWTPRAVVKSRTAPPYRFTVRVTNDLPANVVEVRIVNPQPSLWAGLRATAGASSGLTPQGVTSSGGVETLRFTGTLPKGSTAVLAFEFTGAPTVAQTTFYPFDVVVVPSNGGNYSMTFREPVASAVPIPEVAQLSILSNAGGHVLSWVNTERPDAEHDGVVVFRTPAPGVPTDPVDFVDYSDPANRPADFLHATRDGSALDTLADPTPGAFNYRVCNRDALFVYSYCASGFWNAAGWLESAVPPPGGWTHQLGGSVQLLPGVVPGNRVGVATNLPSIAVLDLATGDRSFDPASLAALPSQGTPTVRLRNGRLVLFAADVDGNVTALDAEAGTPYWQVAKAGESFVAGVSGVLWQYAPAAFRAAYPGDILLLASSASGRVLALDATNGATLWTVTAGAELRATVMYDAETNRLFVPTSGAGIAAYDLGTSGPSTPPSPVAGWANPGGTYRLPCGRALASTEIACIDTGGVLRALAKANGATTVSFATGVTMPSTLVPIGGAAPGFVVSSSTTVQRLRVSGAPPAIAVLGQWTPGVTLSPVQALSGAGAIYVGASDKRVHKLSLANASPTGATVAIASQPAAVFVGTPAYDARNHLLVFGTSDGRVWAVKTF